MFEIDVDVIMSKLMIVVVSLEKQTDSVKFKCKSKLLYNVHVTIA